MKKAITLAIAIPMLAIRMHAGVCTSEEYGFTASFPGDVFIHHLPANRTMIAIMQLTSTSNNYPGVVSLSAAKLSSVEINKKAILEGLSNATRNTYTNVQIMRSTFNGHNAIMFKGNSDKNPAFVKGITFFSSNDIVITVETMTPESSDQLLQEFLLGLRVGED